MVARIHRGVPVLPLSFNGRTDGFDPSNSRSSRGEGAIAGVAECYSATSPTLRSRVEIPPSAPSFQGNTLTLGCIWRLLNRPNGIRCCVATVCNHRTISPWRGSPVKIRRVRIGTQGTNGPVLKPESVNQGTIIFAPVAQTVQRLSRKEEILGSTPGGCSIL